MNKYNIFYKKVIIIAAVGIISGFTKVILVVGVLSLACCAFVWGTYLTLRVKKVK